MPKQQREIIIVGDDNKWLATLTNDNISDKDIQDEINEIIALKDEQEFDELYVYDAVDISYKFKQ